ncbi:MAG: hypothetical protein KDA20_06025 [Phycisphaerales bacterium]|nr:hypothetical protein [Phycisphaerales bacterium]
MSSFDVALFARTVWIALAIGVLATFLAIPAAWALRRLGGMGGALLLAPMLVPSHLVYASWGLARAAGTPLGDYFERIGSDPDTGPSVWNAVNLTHAILALSLWAWPIAALVMSIWTRAIERDAIDALRCLGAGRLRVAGLIARAVAPGAVVAALLVSAMMIGSAIPLHLAQQRTYALVIWSEIAQGNGAGAWRASWPVFVVAVVAGVAVTVALVRGMDPSKWRGQARDGHVGTVWIVLAALVWCVSTALPFALVVWSVRDVGAVARFWDQAGARALASGETAAGVVLVSGVICGTCAGGFGRSAQLALRASAIALVGVLAVLFFVPGVLVGAGLAGTVLGGSLGGLTVAHVARFGLVAAIGGMLIARSESQALHDARRIFGSGARGWMRAVALPQAGFIAGALGAVAILSMHEIESAVLLARAGHATLSQYMLDLLHYFRTDELLAALVWMQGLGLACACGVAIVMTCRGRPRNNTGALAPLLLVMLVIAGCSRASSDGSEPIRAVRTMGETGRGSGQLVFPRAIDSDGQSLWVIDKTARVQRFDADGAFQASWTMPRQDRGRPCGVTCGRDGLIYVADTHEHRVMVYRPTGEGGELVRAIGTYGTGAGEFIYPTDVAIAWGGDGVTPKLFFVAEYGGNDRISMFDADWRFLYDIRGGEEGFARPQSIAFDGEREELVVVDASHHRVGVFTTQGELVRWIGKRDERGATFGDEPGAFSQPFGLALLGDHTALVTEIGAQRVQRIDLESGACLGVYGHGGWGEGELIQPWGITVIGPVAYVLDSGKDRVVAFRHGGEAPRHASGTVASSERIGEDGRR